MTERCGETELRDLVLEYHEILGLPPPSPKRKSPPLLVVPSLCDTRDTKEWRPNVAGFIRVGRRKKDHRIFEYDWHIENRPAIPS
ncbi:MAG: hypothetical protein CEN88_5 [Candidatus Berkelbacteria bacterium Licking1014_2]|uniref:Uncharacterized protein n=1 Tax=Candidatus Berkelbacteria bacterium Licking1014_2 TaxID=2017146 RepID=A0A554LXB4_9BACT|nr:MAG: hypothetical protein CEN88_5 [Candidatus Berkelbacteria bacterium Licking1014_2]